VWNKQRKAETLLNVEDVALGYETRLQWNDKGTWVWSDKIAHPPVISKDTFEQAERRLASRGPSSAGRTVIRTRHGYALTGLLMHGQCGRRMQGSWNNQQAHYRCRFPSEYAIANKVDHPITVYLREAAVLGPLDTWLARAFDPSRIEHTLTSMEDLRPDTDVRAEVIRATLEECDRKLARHRAALEAGADPALVAAWSREVQAEQIAAQAQLTSLGTSHAAARRMTKDEIRGLVDALGGLLSILHEADPRDKLEVYRRLGLRLTYHHESGIILAETKPPPGMCVVSVSEGGLEPPQPLPVTSTSS
jgi:site-specific DNA recombinase